MPQHLASPLSTNEKPLPHAGAFKSGFVALVGRPNVGKSSLLNQVLGQKVAITSSVVQTTRHRIRGIYTRAGVGQVVFLDTPGFSKPIDELGHFLVDEASAGLNEAELCLMVVDATLEPGPGEIWIASQLAKAGKPVILALNKVDRLAQNPALREQRRLAYEQCLQRSGVTTLIKSVAVSAKTGKQTQKLLDVLLDALPEGVAYYDDDDVTDQRLREISAELIREQVLRQTSEELPHSVAVAIEQFHEPETSDEKVVIEATLFVDQPSQKQIVIGKGGSKIKAIGQAARFSIEHLLERSVFLDLQVKLKKNWRKDPHFLASLGLAPPSR